MATLRNDTVVRSADGQGTSAIVTATNIGTYGVAVNSTYYVGTTQNVFNRASGAQTLTGVSIDGNAATVTTNANLTGHITSVGNATSLGSFTSAQLLAALTDETGTGANVFATSPTLVSPILGTPTSGNLANCTFPTLNQNTTGTSSNITAYTINQNVGSSNSPTFATLQLTRLNFGADNAQPWTVGAGGTAGTGLTFGGDYTSSQAYKIFTAMENVGGNYSKLTLNWHTGIRIGAYYGYGGTRFYNNLVGEGTEIFSVGNADSNVRVVNNIYAQSFYDITNTAYYLDPASTSSLNILNLADYVDVGTYIYLRNNLRMLNSGANGWLETIVRNSGNPYFQNSIDGGTFLASDGAENNNWLFQENARGWGLFYFNRGTQSGQTFGNYTTVGAETFIIGQGSGTTMTSTWTGYNASSKVAIMLSNYTGYIWANDTIFSATGLRAPIFYDSNDTTYYLDPANSGTSLLVAGKVGIGTTSPTSLLHLAGVGGDGVAFLRIAGTASDAFNWGSSVMYANLAATETAINLIGKAQSQYNCSYIGYRHVADGSALNMLSLGLYAADHLVNILGNGNVGIGTTSPANKLHVVGSAYSDTDFRAPIFYDSNDTGYFLNPNSTSNLNNLRAATISAANHGLTCVYYGGGATPTNGYLITTNIDYSTFNMPTVIIEGYAYGNGVPIHLEIVWYAYNNSWTNLSYTNLGAWNPGTVSIGTNASGKVCLHLSSLIYYGRFNVRCIYDQGNAALEGWTVSDATTAALTRVTTISKAELVTSITGNAATTTNGLTTSNYVSYSAFSGSVTSTYGNFTTPGLIIGDAQYGFYVVSGNVYYKSASGGIHYWRNIANNANTMSLDNSGNLTAAGYLQTTSNLIYPSTYGVTQRLEVSNAANNAWIDGLTIAPGGIVTAYGDSRAPIFYDSANTAYYCDPNGVSNLYGVAIRGDVSATSTDNQIFFWGTGSGTTSAIGFKANGGSFANPTGNGDGYNTYLTMDTDGRGWVFRRGVGGTDFTSAYTAGWILNNGIWQANASMRAPIFYDSNNTAYYVDPASNSRVSQITTDTGTGIYLGAQNVSTSSRIIINWHSDADYNYLIGKRAGAWTQPMDITFYTGIRYHAHQTYNAHIFYVTGYDSGEAFSIGKGDGHVRVVNNLYAPIIYDSNNTAYYLDPNSLSNIRHTIFDIGSNVVGATGVGVLFDGNYTSGQYRHRFRKYDDGNGLPLYVDYAHATANSFTAIARFGGGGSYNPFSVYGTADASGDFRAPIFYDSNNTAYYLDPAGTSNLNALVLAGSSYFRPQTWIQMDGSYGMYWPNTNGCHIEGNTLSTYGSLAIRGTRGGWKGIHFYEGGNIPHLMFDGSANGGVYFETGGRWASYYSYAANCWGFGTSTTNSAYNLYAPTGVYSGGRVDGTVFYDANDTGYYCDPASTSRLNTLSVGTGAILINGAATATDRNLKIKGATSTGVGIVLYDGSDNFRCQIYGETSNYGFLDSLWGGWDIKKTIGGNLFLNNNTTYYLNPPSTTNLNNLTVAGDVRSPIFYDSNNTAYYLDPNSTSNLYYITMPYIGNGSANLVVNNGGSENWNAIKINGGNDNNGIGFSNTSHSAFGRNNLSLHVASADSVRFHSSGWDTLFEVAGSSGNAWLKGGLFDSAFTRLVNPGGAYYVTGTSTITGAIKIRLPRLNANTMMRMTVKIYQYNTGQCATIECGGYDYSGDGIWRNIFAYQNSDLFATVNVRFGNDGTYDCVWIGETSSTWSYPQVFVTDFQAGYNNYTSDWGTGWNISFVTTFNTVTDTRVAYKTLNAGNYNSYAPTLTGTGASGTWSINVTGNAATVTNGVYTGTSNTYTGANYFQSNLGTTSGATNTPPLQVYATGTNAAFMSFHRSGSYAVNFGLDSDNVLRIGGWSASANRLQLDMSGNLTVAGAMYGTNFIDSDNTAYFCNPASTSNLVGLTVANTITGSITGNAGGSSASCTGNAASASSLANFTNQSGARYTTDFNSIVTTGFFNAEGTPANSPGGSYGQLISAKGIDTGLQIYGGYTNDNLWFRGWHTSGGTFTSWRAVVHSGNIASQTVASCTGNSATTTLATKATRANGNFYIDDNFGNTVVGNYNAARLQGVFAMGDSYKLAADGTAVGTLYGLAWSHPNFGGVAANLADHGLLILQNGVFKGAWGGGSLRTPGDVRGTLFYDWDNTGYYCDPASTSNLNTITAAGNVTAAQYYTGGWFRNNGSGNGLYNEATTQHFYSDSVNYWNVASSASTQGIRLRTGGHNGTVRGYFIADTNNDVGLLNQDGNWRVRVVGGDYVLFDGSSVRAQIFYDSNDTTYYTDPASTSILNVIRANSYVQKSASQSLSGTVGCTIDVNAAGIHVLTLAASTTISSFTYNNRTANPSVNTIMLVIKYGGTASITWTNVLWANGVTPTITGASGYADVYMLTSYQGTTGVWIGTVVAQGLVSTSL